MKILKDPGFYFLIISLGVFIVIVINNTWIFMEAKRKRIKISPDYRISAQYADSIYEKPNVRRYIANAKNGRFYKGEILPVPAAVLLYHAMIHGDSIKRKKSAIACGLAKDPYSTPYLIQLLNDSNSNIKQAAKDALKHIWGFNLDFNGWQMFWRSEKNSMFLSGRIIGLLAIMGGWLLFLGAIIKKKKCNIYLTMLVSIWTFWMYTICFTLWLGTSVLHVHNEPIYYRTARFYIELCSKEDFIIARIMQYVWIAIGISLLCFGIWYTIKHPAVVKRLLRIN